MRQHPFLVQKLFIDRQGRERVIRVETELVSNQPAQSKDSGFLYSIELSPKIGVCGQIGHGQLRTLEVSAQRENTQMNFGSAELARGQSVEAELNGITADEFLSQIGGARFRCFSGRRQRLLASSFVIDNPNVSPGELRIVRLSLGEDEIDPAADSKFVPIVQGKELGRLQFPLRRHSWPGIRFRQLAREKISQRKGITPAGAPPIGHDSAGDGTKVDNRFSKSLRSASNPFAHLVAGWKIDKSVLFFRSGDVSEPIVHPGSSGCVPLIQVRLLVFDAEIFFQPD